MFKRWFSGKGTGIANASPRQAPLFKVEEQGISFPIALLDNEDTWPLVAYLDQLFEEDYAAQLSDCWLIPWDEIYRLLSNPDHATSVPLLNLPAYSDLTPQLSSQGSLASDDFKVYISAWLNPSTLTMQPVERTGAILNYGGATALMSESVWRLVSSVRQLATAQQDKPGEMTNQIGWSNVRKQAQRAQAKMDGFLDKTVVVKPEKLRLNPRKSELGSMPVIELAPSFEGQPPNWLRSFDAHQQVQDRYRVLQPDGSLTHVLVEPEVKTVLERVKKLPGRRVAGDDALTFVRSPYAVLGDDAETVLDAEEYEQALEQAGIYFHRFRLEPLLREEDQRIEALQLYLAPVAAKPLPETQLRFAAAHEFAPFVQELQIKLASGLPAGFWQGYELELSDFDLHQLAGIEALLARWQKETDGAEFDSVLDLSQYGDRVIGIGEAEHISSPFLVKEATENWLPPEVVESGLDAILQSQWDPANKAQFEQFAQCLDEALAAGDGQVWLPGLDKPLPVQVAQRVYEAWDKQINAPVPNEVAPQARAVRAVLQIEQNIEESNYAQTRTAMLRSGHDAQAVLPELLRPEVQLREHQLKGVAWMQHLFGLSPGDVAGCLLADDMGLGKTIQLLTFLVWYLERFPEGPPALIVAPVSLLDNWERELVRFFYADALPALKLYGQALSAVKFKRHEIPPELKAKGISNLLRPGWMGDARVVLTTYETLRDQEFSLARQQWAIVVCDEAQKLKNPKSMVSQAARAIPARFRVACTGTPVENSLIDLWCLFDFIQPGCLGGLNQFGRDYQRPIEAGLERDAEALERLRALIEPQTLRRTKQDVAKDLPAKIEDQACRALLMHGLQKNLYLSEVASYSQQKQLQEHLDQRSSGMLGLLHKLKLICAHPFSVQPDPRLREQSPKMQWLLRTLEAIKASGAGDKVILFTELRDIQRELQHVIQTHFGFRAIVINGDTSTNSQSAQSRQKLIDQFQASPGFGVIILSTVAVGFGVNVQAANHVIHFTRCWNPAKEDQATDRAYRIGQEKDVFVYYPTIRDPNMPTFEATLDELLAKRRALAKDMLHGTSEIRADEFEALLNTK